MVSSRSRFALGVLAAIASALLLFTGTGLRPVWWLTWLAPLPVLLVATRMRAGHAFAIAILAWLAGSMNMWVFYRGVLHLPLGVVLPALVVPACVFGLIVLVHRGFAKRGLLWAAVVSVPVLWVTYEFLTSLVSPHGTFGNLAYTQMDFLPLLQIASLTGLWGITFCLLLLPGAISALVATGAGGAKWTLAIGTGGLLCLVLLHGYWRLHSGSAADSLARVTLIASDLPSNRFTEQDADTLRLLREYAAEISRLPLRTDADHVIVLPEKIGVLSDAAVGEADAIFRQAAVQSKAMILAGIDRGSTQRRSNEARIYSPEGSLKGSYTKQHLIPGFEDVDVPGTSRMVSQERSGLWGIEICKDMDFPLLSRQYGNDGIGLLLVPAWDFEVDGWLHSRMAVMRGVESGFTIVRSPRMGLLTVSDNRGRIIAEKSSGEGSFSVLVADAPVSHASTMYARWGDWFAWLNLAAAVGLLLGLARLRIKPEPQNMSDLQ